MDLTAFPGGDLVQEGLADLARGIESIPALLVSIGALCQILSSISAI
jgi:hypothetical protein